MKCKVRVYTKVRKWKQYIVEGDCINHCRSIAVNLFKDEFPEYADELSNSVTTMIPYFHINRSRNLGVTMKYRIIETKSKNENVVGYIAQVQLGSEYRFIRESFEIVGDGTGNLNTEAVQVADYNYTTYNTKEEAMKAIERFVAGNPIYHTNKRIVEEGEL